MLFCCCPYRRLAGRSFSYRGEASHRTARLAPAVIEGRKKQEGSVQFSTPPMQQNEGVYISPLLAASTNHVAFYSSIITGFEGRKKTFHVFCRSGCVSRMFGLFLDLKCGSCSVYLLWMRFAFVFRESFSREG